MKFIYYSLCIVSMLSCSKNTPNLPEKEQVKHELDGSWNWVYSTGGFAGQTLTPAKVGYNEVLLFTDSILKTYRNDSLFTEKAFEIRNEISIYTGKDAKILFYDQGTRSESYQINGDSLFLYEECTDCYSKLYLRAK